MIPATVILAIAASALAAPWGIAPVPGPVLVPAHAHAHPHPPSYPHALDRSARTLPPPSAEYAQHVPPAYPNLPELPELSELPPSLPPLSLSPRSGSDDGSGPIHIPMSRGGLPPELHAQYVKRLAATFDGYERRKRRRDGGGDGGGDEYEYEHEYKHEHYARAKIDEQHERKRQILPESPITVTSHAPLLSPVPTVVPIVPSVHPPIPSTVQPPEPPVQSASASTAPPAPVSIAYPPGKDKTGKANDSLGVTAADLTNWARSLAYTVDVDIGTPPQRVSLLVDTGSPDLWIFNSRCNGTCPPMSSRFNSSQSTSWASVNKPLNLNYLKGQASGLYGTDVVTLAGQTVNGFEVGLVSAASGMGFSETTMSGIIGLSLPFPRAVDATGRPINHSPPFWSEVAHTWTDKQFGLFLGRDNTTLDRVTAKPIARAGQLTLGGTDSSKYTGNLTYVNVIPTTEYQLPSVTGNNSVAGISGSNRGTTQRALFWSVPMDGMNVDDVPIDMGSYAMNKVAILDSGTTAIYGPPAAVRAFYTNIPTASYAGSNVWVFRCDAVKGRRVTMLFGGREFALEASDLIMASAQGTGQYAEYCIGSIMQFDQPDSYWLIGDAFLVNVYTAYRLDPPSVGFAPLADSVNWKYKGEFSAATMSTSASLVAVVAAVLAAVVAVNV